MDLAVGAAGSEHVSRWCKGKRAGAAVVAVSERVNDWSGWTRCGPGPSTLAKQCPCRRPPARRRRYSRGDRDRCGRGPAFRESRSERFVGAAVGEDGFEPATPKARIARRCRVHRGAPTGCSWSRRPRRRSSSHGRRLRSAGRCRGRQRTRFPRRAFVGGDFFLGSPIPHDVPFAWPVGKAPPTAIAVANPLSISIVRLSVPDDAVQTLTVGVFRCGDETAPIIRIEVWLRTAVTGEVQRLRGDADRLRVR